MVYGNGEYVRKAKELIYASDSTRAPTSFTECTICMDEMDSPVRIAFCGHTACNECFTQHCTTARQAQFPLRCFGQDCDNLIPVQQFRQALSKEDFDTMVQQSLRNHFERNVLTYAKCAGADCHFFYPITDPGDPHTCPQCLIVNCPKCKDEYHFDETCADYQDRKAGHLQALEEAMLQFGAKRCKNCGAIIEKLEGCNHIVRIITSPDAGRE